MVMHANVAWAIAFGGLAFMTSIFSTILDNSPVIADISFAKQDLTVSYEAVNSNEKWLLYSNLFQILHSVLFIGWYFYSN